MTSQFIKVGIRDHVATVTIDRPPVNAMNRELLEDIRDAFGNVAADWDVRAVVFASACERSRGKVPTLVLRTMRDGVEGLVEKLDR